MPSSLDVGVHAERVNKCVCCVRFFFSVRSGQGIRIGVLDVKTPGI